MDENRQNEEKKVTSISALPDFSQIYSFLTIISDGFFSCHRLPWMNWKDSSKMV